MTREIIFRGKRVDGGGLFEVVCRGCGLATGKKRTDAEAVKAWKEILRYHELIK